MMITSRRNRSHPRRRWSVPDDEFGVGTGSAEAVCSVVMWVLRRARRGDRWAVHSRVAYSGVLGRQTRHLAVARHTPEMTMPRGARLGASSENSAVALLLDLGLLATEVAQVVELRTADVTTGHDLDVVDDRAVHGERALHADLEADLADREGLAHTVARAADDDALEDLDARARAFGDVDVHLDGVAG